MHTYSDLFDDYLDSIHEEVSILEMAYNVSSILKEIDPITYRVTFSDTLLQDILTDEEWITNCIQCGQEFHPDGNDIALDDFICCDNCNNKFRR